MFLFIAMLTYQSLNRVKLHEAWWSPQYDQWLSDVLFLAHLSKSVSSVSRNSWSIGIIYDGSTKKSWKRSRLDQDTRTEDHRSTGVAFSQFSRSCCCRLFSFAASACFWCSCRHLLDHQTKKTPTVFYVSHLFQDQSAVALSQYHQPIWDHLGSAPQELTLRPFAPGIQDFWCPRSCTDFSILKQKVEEKSSESTQINPCQGRKAGWSTTLRASCSLEYIPAGRQHSPGRRPLWSLPCEILGKNKWPVVFVESLLSQTWNPKPQV